MSTLPPRARIPLPTGRGWWLVVAGVAVGLALFLLLWSGQRDPAPYRDDVQAPAAASRVFRPLPAPPVPGAPGAAEIAIPEGAARIDEPETAPLATARDDRAEAAPPPSAAAGGVSASAPVPIESPSPDYPARALRRRESGEVLLRIEVDPRGVPASVEVASTSGSRDLDRAAARAARRWRFRPAMRDGTPVAGVVNVPIRFDARP